MSEDIIQGVYWTQHDPAAHTAHMMVQYRTKFSDGTVVGWVRASIGGGTPEFQVHDVPSGGLSSAGYLATTKTLDTGAYNVVSNSFYVAQVQGYFVPGDPHVTDAKPFQAYYYDGNTGSFWQSVGAGFGQSLSPIILVGIGVMVVLVAIFVAPRILRRLIAAGAK